MYVINRQAIILLNPERVNSDDTIDFNSVTISSVQSDSHLGNLIGKTIKEQSVKKVTDDFLIRFYVLFLNLISVVIRLNIFFFKHIPYLYMLV